MGNRRRMLPPDGFWYFIIVVLVTAVMVSGAFSYVQRRCATVGEMAGVEVRWDVFAGCFVEHEGQFIPYDRWVYVTGGDQ